ncbi:uncharacterized protein [Pyxicephalus adspersus]
MFHIGRMKIITLLSLMFIIPQKILGNPAREEHQCMEISGSNTDNQAGKAVTTLCQITASNGSWTIDWFCIGEGLYGKNLSFKIGKKMCELPASNSPINVTCIDNYKAFLVSDNCTALLRENSTKMLQLEVISEVPILPNCSDSFGNKEKAINYIDCLLNSKNGTDNNNGTSVGKVVEIPVNIGGVIGGVIGVVIIIIIIIYIYILCRRRKKKESNKAASQKDIPEMTPLNSKGDPVQMNNTQDSSNGHAVQNGETSQSLV